MESAIPQHLKCPRSRQRTIDDDYAPPFPATVARFSENVTQLVIAFIGVQYKAEEAPKEAVMALQYLQSSLAAEDAPGYVDQSKYIDDQHFTNQLSIAYWLNVESYQRWQSMYMKDWVNGVHSGESCGTFIEVLSPSVEGFETLFSSAAIEGAGNLSEHLSEPVQEHAYWGSMRDRLALSQTEQMKHSGQVEVISKQRYQYVVPHQNLCLIRSGQDWTETQGEERQMYLNEVEPTLREGMQFLSEQGREIGCYCNRYLRILDDAGQVTDRTFGLSLWRDIEDLESWAKSHATHQAIFGAAMNYLGKYEAQAQLKLYHEVMVVTANQQSYQYFNCHPDTGMLRAR